MNTTPSFNKEISNSQYSAEQMNEPLKQEKTTAFLPPNKKRKIEQLFSQMDSNTDTLQNNAEHQRKTKKIKLRHVTSTNNTNEPLKQEQNTTSLNPNKKRKREPSASSEIDSNSATLQDNADNLPKTKKIKHDTQVEAPQTPATPPAKADFSRIAKTMKEAGGPEVTEAQIKEFIERGGSIEILEESKPITLNKSDHFIVGCSSGVNRSQVARAFLLNNGCQVLATLAGGDSGMNPEFPFPYFNLLYSGGEADQKAFKEAFGFDKIPQLGFNELQNYDFNQPVQDAWFKNYFNQLPAEPHQFLIFAASGPSVMRRLLDRQGDLKNFKITYIPWVDEIGHPSEGIERFSAEAYKAFFDKLSRNLIIS